MNAYQASVGHNPASNSVLDGIPGAKEFFRFEPTLKIGLIAILEFRERMEKQNLKLGPGDGMCSLLSGLLLLLYSQILICIQGMLTDIRTVPLVR